MEDYTLEFLIKVFTNHGAEYAANPVNEGNFNLSKAFLLMCEKIKEIEEKCDGRFQ